MKKYHLHRKENEIKDSETITSILKNGQFATIGLCRDNEPYVVTMNYGYDAEANALYFHCANAGLKLDFIRANAQACGTVIVDCGYKDGECDHGYQTIVFTGPISFVRDLDDKCHALTVMIHQLESDPEAVRERIFSGKMKRIEKATTILKLEIETITGKQGE